MPLQHTMCVWLSVSKLQKATINIVMSIWPSVRMSQLGFHRKDFHEIWYFIILKKKSFEKIQVSLKPDKYNGYFTQRPIYIFGHVSSSSSQIGKRQTNVAARIRTHILCSTPFFFFSESCALYEIMWKNIVQPDRSQITIWRMRIACCMPMATNTVSEYVTLIAFPRQK